MEQSRLADTEEPEQKLFLERIKSLSSYTLTDDECHTALMLLFYFRSALEVFTARYLNDLLYGRNSFIENKMAETSARNLYIQAQKHFTLELGRERREPGCNDATEVAAYTEQEPQQACSSCSARTQLTSSSGKPLTLQTSAM